MSRRVRTLPITCKPSSKIGAPTPVGKVRPVLTEVPEESNSHDDHAVGPAASSTTSLIDGLVREGARRMLAEALQAEVDAYIARHAGECDDHGGWWCATAPTSRGRCSPAPA